MQTNVKPLLTLTAGDLMSSQLIPLPEEMPLREAALRLLKAHIGGAPVVNAEGRCLGVVSTTDFLRLAVARGQPTGSLASPLPVSCAYQTRHRNVDGEETTLCSLPFGACAIQERRMHPRDGEQILCRQPHEVLVDWQVVDLEKLPTDPVRQYMTPDPITVHVATPIRVVARKMIDAHIHRVIVVNGGHKPVGIVSSADVLVAVANATEA